MLTPCLKDTIWGGTRLKEEYGFRSEEDNIAEAWLLSCHKDGPAVIKNGVYAGKTLAQALEQEGNAALGTNNADKPDFPILIKLIDARDKLSVQVHPGDDYARRVENENGKTEAWYILDCTPGAQLVYGLKKKVSRKAFTESIRQGRLEELLQFVTVKKGDVVFIPSGMLHAIGAGILLAEVQQSSNTTYRVYDYNRPGKDGKPRELHVKKAADVVDLSVPEGDFSPTGKPQQYEGAVKTLLTQCAYFKMSALNLDGSFTDTADESSFVSLLVLDGAGAIVSGTERLELKKGDSVFIPAGKGGYTLEGSLRLLETRT